MMSLPEPDTHCFDEDTHLDVWSYSPELVQKIVEQQLRKLLALVEKKNEALHEVRQVFETPDHPGISDTVWVVGNRPETLYDCTLDAIDLTADDVELVEVDLNSLEYDQETGFIHSENKLYAIRQKGK